MKTQLGYYFRPQLNGIELVLPEHSYTCTVFPKYARSTIHYVPVLQVIKSEYRFKSVVGIYQTHQGGSL